MRYSFLETQIRSVVARTEVLEGKTMSFDEESRALYGAVAPHHSNRPEVVAQIDSLLPGRWDPPDGVVTPTDYGAIVDKFRNLPTAPVKARSDIVNSDITQLIPDRKVDFVDISVAVDAYQGTGTLCVCPVEFNTTEPDESCYVETCPTP